MHDLVDYESRGIPSVMVATSEFVNAAEYQASALGMSGVARQAAYVAHPIQDATDAEIRSKAQNNFQAIVYALIQQDLPTKSG